MKKGYFLEIPIKSQPSRLKRLRITVGVSETKHTFIIMSPVKQASPNGKENNEELHVV